MGEREKGWEEITITTLGASGDGKTCFLVAMYAVMRAGVRGFTLSASDLDQDLTLADWWDDLEEVRGEDRWPPPNDGNPAEYEFNLNYALTPWKKFTWLDYRGGALRDKGDAPDVKVLQSYMSRSDAVFVCVPGEKILGGRRDSSIGRMLHYISDLRSRNKNPSVAIVITKSDLLIGKMDPDSVISRVRQWFEPLFVSGGQWTVLICPVTLGKELAATAADGAIGPRNIHLPVSFAVYQRLARESSLFSAYLNKASSRPVQKRNLWRRVFSSDVDSSAGERESQLRNASDDAERKLKILREDLMEDATIFFDGKRIEIDD